MGPDSLQYAIRAAHWLSEELDERAQELLRRFHTWLGEEAIPGGGVGPNEAGRLWSRHIADSLLFGVGLGKADDCADLGSGAGLPGVPLAIVHEETNFALVDKSERRCELLSRITAVLRLDNCTVIHSDLGAVDRQFGSVVSRATMPVDDLLFHVKRVLVKGGTGAIGLSRVADRGATPPTSTPGLTADIIDVPDNVLDTAVQLLRIVSI